MNRPAGEQAERGRNQGAELTERLKEFGRGKLAERERIREAFWGLIESNCYYCGAAPQNRSGRGPNKGTPYLYNGIDRVDSSRGYSPDNVRPCCWICNRMKHVLSESEFLGHLVRVLEYSAKRLAA